MGNCLTIMWQKIRQVENLVAMLQNPLNDATAVWVCGQDEHLEYICQEPKKFMQIYLAPECLNNELEAGRFYSFNALLDHMVAILVLHAFQNIAIKLLDD